MNLFMTTVVATVVIFFNSCSKENKGNVLMVSEQTLSQEELSKYFSINNKITLKEDSNYFLQEVSLVESFENKLLVLDRFDSKQVLVFEKSTGNFLYNVGFTGEGPGGYTYPYDVYIDVENEEILVLTLGRVNHYNIHTGNYVSSEIMPLPAVRFEKLDDSRWLLSLGGGANYKLCVTDNKFNLIENFLESKPMYSMLPWMAFVKSRTNELLYFRNYDNTLYSVNGQNQLEEYLNIEFEESPLTEEEINSIQSPLEVGEKLANKSLVNRHYIELEDYNFFVFTNAESLTAYFENIKTGEVKLFDVLDCNNDITENDYFPIVVGGNKNELIAFTRSNLFTEDSQDLRSNDELITLVTFTPSF